MYSLRFQLLFSIVAAATGTVVAASLFNSTPLFSAALFIFSIIFSYGVLYFFVVKPFRKIASLVESQKTKETAQRVVIETSDEFLRLSDTLNTIFDSFRSDISRMKKLEHVRTEFLGNVSHELRTPIFSTQGLLETLLSGAIDDKKVNKDFVQKALNNTERLNSLLGELIDISRIESGEMKLRFRFFDIVLFLQNIVQEMQIPASQRKIQLKLDGDVSKQIDVYGDKDRLQQVIVNLIDNAIKYSEPNDMIAVHFVEKKDRVEVSVEDTGIGIAPQHLPRIFERFYRVDRDRSREMGGTGLGLAIVKHIVEAHDAEIKVTSDVGVGSKFTFWVNKQV
ncbi:MAG: ATP-binding protein [Ignavibacteriales bacterium]|nr:ATP-binding protein [Ignavibacteriales bacterium]